MDLSTIDRQQWFEFGFHVVDRSFTIGTEALESDERYAGDGKRRLFRAVAIVGTTAEFADTAPTLNDLIRATGQDIGVDFCEIAQKLIADHGSDAEHLLAFLASRETNEEQLYLSLEVLRQHIHAEGRTVTLLLEPTLHATMVAAAQLL